MIRPADPAGIGRRRANDAQGFPFAGISRERYDSRRHRPINMIGTNRRSTVGTIAFFAAGGIVRPSGLSPSAAPAVPLRPNTVGTGESVSSGDPDFPAKGRDGPKDSADANGIAPDGMERRRPALSMRRGPPVAGLQNISFSSIIVLDIAIIVPYMSPVNARSAPAAGRPAPDPPPLRPAPRPSVIPAGSHAPDRPSRRAFRGSRAPLTPI